MVLLWGPKTEPLSPGSLEREARPRSLSGMDATIIPWEAVLGKGGAEQKAWISMDYAAKVLGGPGVLGSMAKLVMMLRSRKS